MKRRLLMRRGRDVMSRHSSRDIFHSTVCRRSDDDGEGSNKWEKKAQGIAYNNKRQLKMNCHTKNMWYNQSHRHFSHPLFLLISSGLLSSVYFFYHIISCWWVDEEGVEPNWIIILQHPFLFFISHRIPRVKIYFICSNISTRALNWRIFCAARRRICFNQIMFWLSLCCGICY